MTFFVRMSMNSFK